MSVDLGAVAGVTVVHEGLDICLHGGPEEGAVHQAACSTDPWMAELMDLLHDTLSELLRD